MQDLIIGLDHREQEIHEFIKTTTEEREKLVSRLNEIERMLQDADHDLRKLNKARNALRNPDEQEMKRADMASMTACVEATPIMQQAYFPGRG